MKNNINHRYTYLICLLARSLFLHVSPVSAQNNSRPLNAKQRTAIQQKYALKIKVRLQDRVQESPPVILQKFSEAGMSPKAHALTAPEQLIVNQAFALLPPFHQAVLNQHLRSISFLDEMPNTALTAALNPDDTFRVYHITIRAAILKQTVSEWLTEKESTCFDTTGSPFRVAMEEGSLNALPEIRYFPLRHLVALRV
jgi:hypothetical protein